MFHGKKSGKWIAMKSFMIVAFIALLSWVLMVLWNWLIPDIMGFKAVTYLQAIGLLVLFRLLFGGFGRGHGPYHSRYHGHYFKKPDEKESTP